MQQRDFSPWALAASVAGNTIGFAVLLAACVAAPYILGRVIPVI